MVPGLPVPLGTARVVVRGHRVSSEYPGRYPGHPSPTVLGWIVVSWFC